MSINTSLYYFKDNDFIDPLKKALPLFDKDLVIYEVVRMISGVVVFFEEHMRRLEQSISMSNVQYALHIDQLRNALNELARINNNFTGNIKIVLHSKKGMPGSLYAFFIPHFYPNQYMYMNGVDADLFKAERTDPNIKKMHMDIAGRISSFISTSDIYEALLVDDQNCITEGSKTNVFFVRGNIVYTAGADRVLLGITRQKVLELCKIHQVKIIERAIPVTSMADFDAAFFTGTSPKVLPIKRIANAQYAVTNIVMRRLMAAYDNLMNQYIALHR